MSFNAIREKKNSLENFRIYSTSCVFVLRGGRRKKAIAIRATDHIKLNKMKSALETEYQSTWLQTVVLVVLEKFYILSFTLC